MACLDGDIYLRKDFITCDPKTGTSLKSLMQYIIDDLVTNSGGGTGTAFSCTMLNGCGIASLSDIITSGSSEGDVLTKLDATTYKFLPLPVSGATKLSELSDVSGTDGLTSSSDGYALKWSNGDQRFVPGPIQADTTNYLTIGGEDAESKISFNVTNTNSDFPSRTPDFKIIGTGGVSVVFSPDKNQIEISLYSAPAFVGSYVRPNSNNNNKIYVGQTLNTLNFGFTAVNNKGNIKPLTDVELKGPKYNGTAFVSNQSIKTFPYNFTDTNYATTSTSTAFQTGTAYVVDNLGSLSYTFSGTGKDNSTFQSSTSISRCANLYYGTVANRDSTLTNTQINGSTVREISTITQSFLIVPNGNYIWFAIPTVIVDNALGIIEFSTTQTGSKTNLAEHTRYTVNNVTSGGGQTVQYTVIVGANEYNSPETWLHLKAKP
jgi:hypothetical protein